MNNNQLLTSCFSLIKCWVTAGQQVCGECCSAPCLLPSFHRHWWNFFISWISDLHYMMDENEPFLTSIIAKQGCGICTSSKAENASFFFLFLNKKFDNVLEIEALSLHRVCIGTMNKINPSFPTAGASPAIEKKWEMIVQVTVWICAWQRRGVDKRWLLIIHTFTWWRGKKSRFLFFGLHCEADMTMQTLIAVCDSLWLDSTANMLSQIVIYSFLVLSIFYLKNCHQGVLWLIYCMLFSPPPLFFGITIDRFRRR